MSDINEAWREAQRRRCLRANWQLYVRADAYRFAPPGTPEAKMPGWLDPSATRVRWKEAQEEEARARAAAEQEEFERDLEALRESHQRVRIMLADVKFELALRGLGRKYSENQPRVPKGNPDGGQWIRDAGKEGGRESSRTDGLVSAPTDLSSARRSGHHYLPQGVYKNRRLSDETRQVFEEATTGPLQDKRLNTFSRGHREYNEAADQLFDQFLQKKGLTEEQMTPDHARQLLGEVITSRDSRIQRFNQRIWMRQIFQGGRFRGNE